MKTRIQYANQRERTARSVLECGSPLPLSRVRESVNGKSARGLAQSKTWRLFLTLLLFSSLQAQLSTVLAQGTAFTYQGRLNDASGPANGLFDFQFALHSTSAGSNQVGTTVAASSRPVTNGLFTVPLSFPEPGLFDGADRWLEIAVRPTGDPFFTTLSPRQKITATPYAITAGTVTGDVTASQVTGTIPLAQLPPELVTNGASGVSLSGTFTGNGAGLTGLNASQLTVGTVPAAALGNAWKTTGNAGTTPGTHSLGTTDNRPLEFKVNNQRGWRLEYANDGSSESANLIGGYGGNSVSAGTVGAVIVAGGKVGAENTIGEDSDFSAIGGGLNNKIGAISWWSTIAGGFVNIIGTNSDASMIGGGADNNIAGSSGNATIAGGFGNDIGRASSYSFVGGGQFNRIASNSFHATLAGGHFNDIGVDSDHSTIGGGENNNIASNSFHATIAGGDANNIGTNSHSSAIGGGSANNIAADSWNAAIAGGANNDIGVDSDGSAIGGGGNNDIAPGSSYATIAGGAGNDIGSNSDFGAIGGGQFNNIASNAQHAIIPGGVQNVVGPGASYAFAAGRRAKANHPGTFVWADSQNADLDSTRSNQFLIRASGGVGIGETAPQAPLHISEGNAGSVTANANSIAVLEKSSHSYLSMLTPAASESGIIFGTPNSSVEAGIFHLSSAGINFRTGTNSTKMVIQPGGNVGIGTSSPTNKLHVIGGVSATAFVSTSDRNAKENFAPVSPRDVLNRVATLPISTWNFKELKDGRHMGPTAQDFHAAFGLGAGETTITTIDPDGVALAAIQGLNQKVEEQRGELKQKETEIAELKQRLERLEQFIDATSGRTK